MTAGVVGRPKPISAKNRRYIALDPHLTKQVAEIAARERRTFAAQTEMLIELGLRTYALENAAA